MKISNHLKYLLGFVTLIVIGCSEDKQITNPPIEASVWEKLNNAPISSTNCFLGVGNTIYAGTVAGLYKSNDYGVTWKKLNISSLSTAPIHSLISYQNKIILGSGIKRGLFSSSDNGTSWHLINTGLPDSAPIRLLQADSLLFVGMADSGVYKSTDSGITWNPTGSRIAGCNVMDLTLSMTNIFVATFFDGVFVSSDYGIHWASLMNGITNNLCQCIVARGDTIIVGTRYGVFRSTDGGQTYSNSFSGLPNENISDLEVKAHYWFVGSDSGIYLSTDNGGNWLSLNYNLPTSTPVYQITSFFKYIYIYAATSGIWRANLDSLIASINKI